MGTLNDQINSFRAMARNAPVIPKRIIDSQAPEPKRMKSAPRPGVVESAHTRTQFVHAKEYLKKNECPILLKDLESYLGTPIEPLIPWFQQHPNIRINLKDQTACYISKFDVYSADDLMRYLTRQKSFVGTSVKELEDGWSAAVPTINRMEEEGKLLVLRNKKDNSPRTVWPNLAGPVGTVDKMFVNLWQEAKVPSTNDLPGTLESAGLKPSSVDPSKVKVIKKKESDQKRRRPARSKITNTHMRGILKDYST